MSYISLVIIYISIVHVFNQVIQWAIGPTGHATLALTRIIAGGKLAITVWQKGSFAGRETNKN